MKFIKGFFDAITFIFMTGVFLLPVLIAVAYLLNPNTIFTWEAVGIGLGIQILWWWLWYAMSDFEVSGVSVGSRGWSFVHLRKKRHSNNPKNQPSESPDQNRTILELVLLLLLILGIVFGGTWFYKMRTTPKPVVDVHTFNQSGFRVRYTYLSSTGDVAGTLTNTTDHKYSYVQVLIVNDAGYSRREFDNVGSRQSRSFYVSNQSNDGDPLRLTGVVASVKFPAVGTMLEAAGYQFTVTKAAVNNIPPNSGYYGESNSGPPVPLVIYYKWGNTSNVTESLDIYGLDSIYVLNTSNGDRWDEDGVGISDSINAGFPPNTGYLTFNIPQRFLQDLGHLRLIIPADQSPDGFPFDVKVNLK